MVFWRLASGKETHIYHIILSSIDWIEDLVAFQVLWTHGVLVETCLGLSSPKIGILFYSESIDLIPLLALLFKQ